MRIRAHMLSKREEVLILGIVALLIGSVTAAVRLGPWTGLIAGFTLVFGLQCILWVVGIKSELIGSIPARPNYTGSHAVVLASGPSLGRLGTALRDYKEPLTIPLFDSRAEALRVFQPALDAETTEIVVIGSTLKPVLTHPDMLATSTSLRARMKAGVPVHFIMTHPGLIGFRSSQEGEDIRKLGLDIITSLEVLRSWGVAPGRIHFVHGAPISFGIRTSQQMCIGMYGFQNKGTDMPATIVKTTSVPGQVYDRTLFSIWRDDEHADPLLDYDEVIAYLRKHTAEYAERTLEFENQMGALPGTKHTPARSSSERLAGPGQV